MKPILFLLLLLLAFPMESQELRRRAVMAKVNADKAASGFSCPGSPTESSTAWDSNNAFVGLGTGGAGDAMGSVGQKAWSPTANGQLCKVVAKHVYAQGTVSGFTYVVRIYETNVCERGGTLLGTSDGVTGNNSWSDSTVTFTFSTPVAVSTTGHYNVLITRNDDGVSGTAYIQMGYGNVGTLNGVLQQWREGGAPTSASCNPASSTVDLVWDLYY